MPRGRVVGDRVGPYDRFDYIHGRDDEAEQRRQRRIAARLTQAELAARARVAERTVRAWERGRASHQYSCLIERVLRDLAKPGFAGLGRSTKTGNTGALD